MRTARSRTSGQYRVVLFITPSSQEMESPLNPGRFSESKPLSFELILETTVLFDEGTSDLFVIPAHAEIIALHALHPGMRRDDEQRIIETCTNG
jgi:hypothetical protein